MLRKGQPSEVICLQSRRVSPLHFSLVSLAATQALKQSIICNSYKAVTSGVYSEFEQFGVSSEFEYVRLQCPTGRALLVLLVVYICISLPIAEAHHEWLWLE